MGTYVHTRSKYIVYVHSVDGRYLNGDVKTHETHGSAAVVCTNFLSVSAKPLLRLSSQPQSSKKRN